MAGAGLIGIGATRGKRRGKGPRISAAISGLTDNPTYGLTAQALTSLNGELSGLVGGETVVHRWTLNDVPIAGENGPSYFVPSVNSPDVNDLDVLRYAPTVDGVDVESPAQTIRRVPPTAGTLAAVNETQGNGTPTVTLSSGFSGGGLVYTVNVNWVTVSGNVLTIDDVVRDDVVTVTASNSGGAATVDLSVVISEVSFPTTDLVMTIETTVPNEVFTLPIWGGGVVNATVDMGAGGGETTVNAATDPALTAVYSSPGIHTIRARGTISQILFGGSPHAANLRTIDCMGQLGWSRAINCFDGCTGLTNVTLGQSDFSSADNFFAAFANCSTLVSIDASGHTFSTATNMQNMFAGCSSLVAVVGNEGFDTASVVRMDEMFHNCPALGDIDISGWDVSSLSDSGGMFNFLTGSPTLSQAVYDAFLIAAAANPPPAAGVFFGMGGSPVTTGGAAQAARTSLINAGMFFDDGLSAVPDVMAAPALSVAGTTITAVRAAEPFNNGLPVNGYDLRISDDGGTTWAETDDIGASVDITGLPADTAHFVQTRAYNFLGDGAWSASANISTEAAASFSIDLSDSEAVYNFPETNGPITLEFPSSPYSGQFTQDINANTLTGNFFAAEQAAGRNVRLTKPVISADGSIANRLNVLPGLIFFGGDPQEDATFQWQDDGVDIPGETGLFYIAPQSTDGSNFIVNETDNGVTTASDPFAFTFTVSEPGIMNAPAVRITGDTQIEVTRAAAPTDNGSAITSYDMEWSDDGGVTWTPVVGVGAVHTVTGLTPNTQFQARTWAINGIGAGGKSLSAVTRTAAGAAFDLSTLGNVLQIDLDLTDAAKVFTDAARTNNVAVTNDVPVAIEDKSPFARHCYINSNNNFWQASPPGLDWDQAPWNNVWIETNDPIVFFPEIVDLYVSMTMKAWARLMPMNVGTGSTFEPMYGLNGSGNAPTNGAGDVIFQKDFAVISPSTSDQLFDAFQTDAPLVVACRNINTANLIGNPLRMFNKDVNWNFRGKLARYVVTTPLDDLQRADVVSKLLSQGIPL